MTTLTPHSAPLTAPAGRAQLLIVDDEPIAVRILQRALREMGVVRGAGSGREALAWLAEAPSDLVLLDAHMPGLDGFDTCRAIVQEYPYLPVIFVTGYSDRDSELRALDAGARDFISKPIYPAVVRARVRLQLAVLQLALTDPLTGAWTRRRLADAVSQEQARQARYGFPLSLLLLDIDHFKRVNDTRGHLVGDQVLVHLVATLRAHLRALDSVSRWGGEEFIVLCPHTSAPDAARLAARLRAVVAAAAGPAGALTVSIGVATCRRGETWESWLQRADQALYQAKARGRNRVESSEGDAPC